MNTFNMLKQVSGLVWRPFLVALGVILLVAVVRPATPGPVGALVVFNLCVLVPVLVNKLVSGKPVLKQWAKLILFTVLSASALLVLVGVLGFFGLFGVLAIVLVFAAYRIYVNWELFDYTTSWGAGVLKGRKEEFDLTNIGGVQDGGLREERREEDAQRETQQGGAGEGVGESQELGGGSQANHEVVQAVQSDGDQFSVEGQEVRPGDVVREVSKRVRESNALRRKKRRVTIRKVELKQEVD